MKLTLRLIHQPTNRLRFVRDAKGKPMIFKSWKEAEAYRDKHGTPNLWDFSTGRKYIQYHIKRID